MRGVPGDGVVQLHPTPHLDGDRPARCEVRRTDGARRIAVRRTSPPLGVAVKRTKAAEPKPRKVVLALDLGTTAGWAILRRDGVIDSGSKSFQPTRMQGGGVRFMMFRQWLDDMRRTYQLETIYFEEVRGHVATIAAQVYGGFLATLMAWCEEHQIPYLGVHTGIWKKSLTGMGNSKKHVVQACVTERLRLEAPPKHDEADAIGVLLHATDRIDDGFIRHRRSPSG